MHGDMNIKYISTLQIFFPALVLGKLISKNADFNV